MINTEEFKYKDSRWQDLYLFLKEKGYEVYPPGVKVGECKAPYLVVKNNGTAEIAGFSSFDELYYIMVYVPKQKYSTLEVLVNEIKKVMMEIQPIFLHTGTVTPSYYDDSYKAHTVSIEYKNHRRKLTLTSN